MTPFWKLSAAGFAATAMTYGPARMGFGLFLPEFRTSFAISTTTAGMVSGLGFLGFFLGLLSAYLMTAWHGPRLPVLAGLGAATLGMGLIAGAADLPLLCAGVFLAMSSAGFTWAPFNNAVNRQLRDDLRPGALSIVSTGTSLGVAAAGLAALVLSLGGLSWRIGWAAFAVAGVLAGLANWAALRDVAGTPGPGPNRRWRTLWCRPALPLYGIALSFGTTTAIYISFAADRIAQGGGIADLPAHASAALMFVSYGIAGLLGLATGRAKAATGLVWLLRLLLLGSTLSLLLVAAMPGALFSVLLSAGLQGIFVMMMSAVLAFWSERLFPDLPSLSFTAALLCVAAGSVFGPLAGAVVASLAGGGAMFFAAATISGATAAAIGRRHIRDRAGRA